MSEFKNNYFAHFKAINPDMENAYRSARHYYAAEILPLLPADRQVRILDVGCGFGHLLRYLVTNGYENSGGVELDPRLFDECYSYIGSRAAFIKNKSALDFLEQNASSFDVIIATDVIEHFTLEEALDFSTAIRKSLNSGGRAIVRTPNMANIFGGYSRYMDTTHQVGFTEQSLAQMLLQAGFTDPCLHIPDWKDHPKRAKFMWSKTIQRWLFDLQDRSPARCFDKNLVMWALAP